MEPLTPVEVYPFETSKSAQLNDMIMLVYTRLAILHHSNLHPQ